MSVHPSAPSVLTVRQATLADQPAIVELLHSAYPGREQYKHPDRWLWQFVDNPLRDPAHVPVWLAFDGTRVVGQTGAMIEPLQVGGREQRVGWSVDTYVRPEYRGCGLGRALQQANQQAHPVFMSLRMSPANARIKAALGGVPLAPVRVLQLRLGTDAAEMLRRVRRTSRALSGMLAATRLAPLAARTCTAGCRATWTLRRGRRRDRAEDIDFQPVDCFGADADAVWQAVSPHYQLLVRRDANYLNWKFVRQPHMRHGRFVIRQDGRACGHLILRRCTPPEPNVGLIVDLFAAPTATEVVEAGAAFAVEWFLREGTALIRAVASTALHERTYQALGFRAYRRLEPMCYPPEIASSAAAPNAVYLSYGDHDLDQFPLTRG